MKTLQFLTLAAVAAIVLFQAPIVRADSQNNGDAQNTFTKWVTDWPNMAGVVGGDVGEGTFTGEVISFNPGAVTTIEALYHFHGSKHSCTIRVHVEQIGLNAVIVGIVTDGWLKGHAVEAEYTQFDCTNGPLLLCYEGTLTIIKSHSND